MIEIKNKIFLSDNIKFMQKLQDKSIDLVFADPPYNLQLQKPLFRINGTRFQGVDDKWDKYESYDKYDQETIKWLKECFRILKEDGSLWVIGSYHNIHRIGYMLQNLNAWIINEIIWEKTNPVPNFQGTRFVNAQETLLWVTKNKKSKFTFNYKTMKELNYGKQMKSIWKIPVSSGKERLKDNKNQKIHSTQKPLKLLELIILASTKYNDLVLDPFSGTGTTAHACKKWGRNYIGIEKEKKYWKASIERIKLVEEIKEERYKKSKPDIKPPKVSFYDLIKKDYIKKYDEIKIKNSKFNIKMSERGTIKFNDKEYSPNQLLKILFKKSLNAWEYFIFNDKPMSFYREKYRKEILNYEN